MKYLLVSWPEIQQYMEHPNYKKEVYYDSEKGVWFVPENMEEYCSESYEEYFGGDIGDLDDSMG